MNIMGRAKNAFVEFIKQNWTIIIVLIIGGIAHSINMFGYPSYREDEGTYMSQAVAVVRNFRLAPYTYWYDHAPMGWIFISLWNLITGNQLFMAGLSVNSGRIFMMVLHVVSALFVYQIAWHITKKRGIALFSTILFSLTPLSIVLYRRVLLDNIMVFWFLLSLVLLTRSYSLRYTILSAVAFALSATSKESAVPLFPAMLIIVALTAHKNTKHFAVVVWGSVAVFAMSFYPLFAVLKGELFPTGTLLGGTNPHVSLWDALSFHVHRSAGGTFLWTLENSWLPLSPIFLTIGSLATIIYLFLYKHRWAFSIALLNVSYLLFILRGQVLDWYIIPIIPLFSIMIGILINDISQFIQKKVSPRLNLGRFAMAMLVILVIVLPTWEQSYIYTLKQTQNQDMAVQWVKENIKPGSITMIDNYAFEDLNPKLDNIQNAYVHYYWKADTDPQIRYNLLNNDWNNIDYLLTTPAVTVSIYNDDLPLIRNAYEKSHVIKRFNEYNIKNEGYPVEIREVNNKNGVIQTGWVAYKSKFITDEGRVIDPISENITTSEGQSYALLRSAWIWEGDKETFDKVLNWTLVNMKQPGSNLFSWKYGKLADGSMWIVDATTASDADEDIALALLFAHKLWGDPKYMTLAQGILKDIWTKEVVDNNGVYYLMSSSDSSRVPLVNPSYFSPASYRIFAQVDETHPWNKLADDTYNILNKIMISPTFKDSTNLVPNWFILNPDGSYASATGEVAQADVYGYDAFRLMWRVALDNVWFKTPDSAAYLKQVSPFFENQIVRYKQVYASYALNGARTSNFNDISTDAGALSTLFITKPEIAIDFYSNYFWPEYKEGFWGDANNYYNQNWAWFATALYADNLPNLWTTPPASLTAAK